MKPDDPNKRFSNAIIYGTSHPEAYKTNADELWDKYVNYLGTYFGVGQEDFMLALNEHGEAVRKQAVSVCKALPRPLVQINTADQCAAAIEKMEMP